jgi:hypothetical protein
MPAGRLTGGEARLNILLVLVIARAQWVRRLSQRYRVSGTSIHQVEPKKRADLVALFL